jgi:surface polysaccharide O-acyltransferase-like enzyme
MLSDEAIKKRIPYLDFLRILACFLVLLEHAPEARFSECLATSSTAFFIYITIVTVGTNIFFLISGALLLPVNKPAREFLPHRLKVILIPLAIWTVIYLVELYCNHTISFQGTLTSFHHPVEAVMWFTYLGSFLYNPVEGSLWFVYVLAIIYAMMPIISKLIGAIGKHGIEYLLAFWIAASFIPYCHGMFVPFATSPHNMLSGFANPAGYVLLGYYLHNYPLPVFSHKHWWKFALIFVFGIVVMPLFEFFIQSHIGITYKQHIDTVINEVSINNILLATLIFLIIKRLSPSSYNPAGHPHLSRLTIKVSVGTFGMYLCHMLLFRTVIWPLTRPYIGQLPVLVDGVICAIIAFFLTYAVVSIIHRAPFGKYIIGH